jgi:hypothetical protein
MIIGAKSQRWNVTGGAITTVTINGVLHQVHTFNANANLVIGGPVGVVEDPFDPKLFARWLVIAGGGGSGSGGNSGGGGFASGSGGAGGVIRNAGFIRPGIYPWVIGAGGIGGAVGFAPGGNGGNTTFNGLTAVGGGGGGAAIKGGVSQGIAGLAGGNGGGGGGDSVAARAGGAGTAGQGFAGQASNGANAYSGNGGTLGMAGGQQPFPTVGFNPGIVDDISGTPTHYAYNGNLGMAGANGAANSGAGGIAAYDNGVYIAGWSGGSGVGIFAFPIG